MNVNIKTNVKVYSKSHALVISYIRISEAEYAYVREVKTIPLLLERDYKPDGWLGLLLGANFYYELHPELSVQEFDNNISRLVQAIGANDERPNGNDEPDGRPT